VATEQGQREAVDVDRYTGIVSSHLPPSWGGVRLADFTHDVTDVNGGRLDWGLPKDHERRWMPVPRFVVDDLAEHTAGKAHRDGTEAFGACLVTVHQ
jgi:hypothetical protein